MAKLAVKIVDKATGEPVEARAQVLASSGQFLHPHDALLKVGPGLPFFYTHGDFSLEAPVGLTRVLVERGTEYVPAQLEVEMPAQGALALDVELERWTVLGAQGWHPGNTHIHYDEHESRPDERLHLDPRVEDLRVTAISILRRWDLEYASNKYAPGVLNDFCSAHHHVECGEENRHNAPGGFGHIGYGHIMLLRIREVVQPVSRGFLVDDLDPDYPPLCHACDQAHRQGGIVIWCHNGKGMEAPVAAALGKLDAFNLFDPYWTDPEYRIWYEMLNCGFRLPASTGSDWFICSGNRVYADTAGPFSYERWIEALQGGHSFITNGPALFLTVDGQGPGATLETQPGAPVSVWVAWESHYAVRRVEVIWNGRAIAAESYGPGVTRGTLETEWSVPSDGWLAARLGSTSRDSYFQPIYAHTGPVYVHAGRAPVERPAAAAQFEGAIERSLDWVAHQAKFRSAAQRQEIIQLFRQGQSVYSKLLRGSA
ncbi:MAG: CehA/McbA family metallohydrolase [Anaerolineae bacterium]|nr:CehA/McbA family metallohydrolase [Anaerolineae bacterium]